MQQYMATITSLSSFNLCALPFLLSAPFILPFLSYIGLLEFKWTSLALQAQSCVDKVWFHPLSSPLGVCVCVRVHGCWPQDCVYELRLLSRRGELLSEPSPSVNVSTVGRCSRATLPPFCILAPPFVSTRPPLSVRFTTLFSVSLFPHPSSSQH